MNVSGQLHSLLESPVPDTMAVTPRKLMPLAIRCALALGGTLLALVISLALRVETQRMPLLIFWIVTMGNFLLYGTAPGYLSAVVSLILAENLIISPQGGSDFSFVGRAIIFLFAATIVNQLLQRQVRAENRIRDVNTLLQERVRTLNVVTDAMPAFIWICDTDRKCTYFNQSWVDFTGRTMREELGMGWLSRIHPEDRDRCIQIYAKAFDDKKPFTMEMRVKRKDGEYRWIQDNGVPLYNQQLQNEFLGYVGTCLDIHNQKMTEERFKAVVTHMPAMLSVYDDDNNRIFWNKECERVTGYNAEEIQNNPDQFELLYPDAELQKEINHFKDMYRGRYRDWEILTRCKDGNMRTISWSNVSQEHPIDGWSDWAIGVDVTERCLVEEALKLSEANLLHALDNSSITVCNIDRNLRYSWAYNLPSFASLTDILDKRDDEIYPHIQTTELMRLKQTVLETGVKKHYALEFDLKAAGRVSYDISIAPVHDMDGSISGLTMVAVDVSHRHKLFEQEKIAKEKAEDADRLKMDFLAMISHELRTPLTSIKGFTTTLLAEDVTWDEASKLEFLNIINNDADRLTELIDQLLDLSRLEAGRLSIRSAPFQLKDMHKTIIGQLQVLVKNHELHLDVADDLPLLLGDSQRVGQVIVNLVGNATRYSPTNKRICIKVFHDKANKTVQIEVADEGPGIPPDKRKIVFEAFRQLENKSNKGAGLGLAICKGLVEAQNGQIWVVDRDGPGTTIAFTIPTVN